MKHELILKNGLGDSQVSEVTNFKTFDELIGNVEYYSHTGYVIVNLYWYKGLSVTMQRR